VGGLARPAAALLCVLRSNVSDVTQVIFVTMHGSSADRLEMVNEGSVSKGDRAFNVTATATTVAALGNNRNGK
jgi:hypothetical protein